MENQDTGYLGIIVLAIVGLLLLAYSIYEIWEEFNLKKALTTTGKVVGKLASRYGARAYDYGGGTKHTTKSAAGNILVFEYEIEISTNPKPKNRLKVIRMN